jgi:hypothetical protein
MNSRLYFVLSTRYNEYLIMLFSIATELVLIQNMINYIFKDMIDLSVIAFIANILIYSQIKTKHTKLIKEGLSYLYL